MFGMIAKNWSRTSVTRILHHCLLNLCVALEHQVVKLWMDQGPDKEICFVLMKRSSINQRLNFNCLSFTKH
jgi:hypothetical protein